MGCDIHAFVEYRRHGAERRPVSDGWETMCWAKMNPGRNYEVFGRLADVRGGDSVIGPPRGIPATLSLCTKWKYEADEGDAHTPSWCTPDEWEKAIKIPPEAGWEAAPDYFAMLAAMREFERLGYEVRVVFWFDN